MVFGVRFAKGMLKLSSVFWSAGKKSRELLKD